MTSIKLHSFNLSGHSHRAQVMASLLGLPVELIHVNLKSGAHKQPEFLAKNPFGQVPVLEDGDVCVPDSNAILVYLATHYDSKRTWLPVDAEQAAQVQGFLSIAAGKLAFGPAVARLVNVFGAGLDKQKAIATSHALFAQLENHLNGRDWLVTQLPTIADVANYTYIAHAPEGDVSLEDYPNMRAWLARFEALPGFVPMQATPVGLNCQQPASL